MPQAARIGDLHLGGPIVAGAPTVFIGGLPSARAGDGTVAPTGPGVVSAGSPTVFIEGRPASRVGDPSGGGVVATGAANVYIGNRPGSGPREGAGGGGAGGGGGVGGDGAAPPGTGTADKAGGAKGGKDGATAPGAAAVAVSGSGKMAMLLGAPVSMELVQLFLAVAAGFLADLGTKMAPAARETLAAAIGSANQVLGLKKFQHLTESLAKVQGALQDASATVPAEELKANAEGAKGKLAVAESVGSGENPAKPAPSTVVRPASTTGLGGTSSAPQAAPPSESRPGAPPYTPGGGSRPRLVVRERKGS